MARGRFDDELHLDHTQRAGAVIAPNDHAGNTSCAVANNPETANCDKGNQAVSQRGRCFGRPDVGPHLPPSIRTDAISAAKPMTCPVVVLEIISRAQTIQGDGRSGLCPTSKAPLTPCMLKAATASASFLVGFRARLHHEPEFSTDANPPCDVQPTRSKDGQADPLRRRVSTMLTIATLCKLAAPGKEKLHAQAPSTAEPDSSAHLR